MTQWERSVKRMIKKILEKLKSWTTYFIGIAFSLLLLFLVVTKNQNLKYMIIYIMGAIVSATLVFIDRKY